MMMTDHKARINSAIAYLEGRTCQHPRILGAVKLAVEEGDLEFALQILAVNLANEYSQGLDYLYSVINTPPRG